MPMVEKLKREQDKVSTLIDGFHAHCKASNVKPTHWEETLSEALRESSRMMENMGSRVGKLRKESTTTTASAATSPSKPHPPLTTSLSQARYTLFSSFLTFVALF